MNSHTMLFKANDWVPLAIILGAPLIGAFINGVFGKRLGKPAVRLTALAVMAISFAVSLYSFLELQKFVHINTPEVHGGDRHAMAPRVKFAWLAWQWLSMASPTGMGRIGIDIKFSIDQLSSIMMLVVTGVGFLIHLYASSYMAKDKGYYRFFSYLNLFVFSMLVLILADNMLLMFVGWEGVGLCSYLLIGFWFDNIANTSAGRKAFIANRIGDVGILAGMLMLLFYTGALDWDGINNGASGLTQRVILWHREGVHQSITMSAATVACLAIFLGCAGKSAQIPLYVWLPDAMAGPTPVSALIHAATMVTSGLYLICRLNPVFVFSPLAMMVIAITGALTALLAATIGLVQNDIKKVLAYSTVSQLGFMFLGVGVGAFSSGFFHVFTHAFFKACLFLGAGSVIHAMHARIHDDVRSQDMRFMGGLKKYMPWTYYAMGISTLAIAGFPLTSGFFSKDGILFHVFSNRVVHPFKASALEIIEQSKTPGKVVTKQALIAAQNRLNYFEAPSWLGYVLFAIGVLAATMTAFYMFRLIFKTFWGDFRGWAIAANAEAITSPFKNIEPLIEDAHEHHDEHHDDHHHHEEDLKQPADPPFEAPWAMTIPVAILGVFAGLAGFLYAEPLHIEPLGHWLAPVFAEVSIASAHVRHGFEKFEWPLMVPGVLAFIIGSSLAYVWYIKGNGVVPQKLAESYPRLYRLLYNKWYVDEAYEATVIGGVDALAEGAIVTDTWVVDGILAKLTALLASAFGSILRAFQNGVVHVYASIMVVASLVLVVFFGSPKATATIQQTGDAFTIEADPGLGYQYKWATSDGQNDKEFSSSPSSLKRVVSVPVDQTKTITLEVKNAFGRTSKKLFELKNPKPTQPNSLNNKFSSAL